MSSTKDCGCLRDADGKIDMTRCPIHPTPSTKDPKKCPTCGYQKGDIDVCSDSFHLDTPQATKPVDELTMTVYFTERQLSELKAGEKLELPLTDDLRQAISNQVASAVIEALNGLYNRSFGGGNDISDIHEEFVKTIRTLNGVTKDNRWTTTK